MATVRTPIAGRRPSVDSERPGPSGVNVRKSASEWEGQTSTTAGTGPAKDTKKTDITARVAESSKAPLKINPRVQEAKQHLVTAKTHLGRSRNLKTDIKEGITKALDLLYQLVKDEVNENKVKGSGTCVKETDDRIEKMEEELKETKEKLEFYRNFSKECSDELSEVVEALDKLRESSKKEIEELREKNKCGPECQNVGKKGESENEELKKLKNRIKELEKSERDNATKVRNLEAANEKARREVLRIKELEKVNDRLRKENDEGKKSNERMKNEIEVLKTKNVPVPHSTHSVVEQPRDGWESRVLTKLEEHYKLLQNNARKIDELKESGTFGGTTYAGAVAAGQSKAKSLAPAALHSVVVSSRDDMDTCDILFEKVRQAMDAKEGWVQVERVRKAKDRKLIVACRTREERDKVKGKLDGMKERFVVEAVKNKDPLLVLRDVLSVNSDDDILRALRNQNRGVFGGLDEEEARMTIRYKKKARNPNSAHIVIAVSPKIWTRATEVGKLHVDLQRVTVEDQSPLVQCTRCLGYGHSKKFCKEPEDLCSHCGGPHNRDGCPAQKAFEPPKCINCVRAGVSPAHHHAFSGECPIRKKWDAIARAAVAYC